MTDINERQSILWEHWQIHRGNMYHAFLGDETMADGDTHNFAFKTPASTSGYVHMTVDWAVKVGGHIKILEAPTWTAQSGTAFTPINANRGSSNTSILTGNETTTTFTANEIAYDVTTILTTNATTIDEQYIFGGLIGDGSSKYAQNEYILKASTTYIIELTADGGSNAGSLRLSWYEYLPSDPSS